MPIVRKKAGSSEARIRRLQDPAHAAAYLNAAYASAKKENDNGLFLKALRNVAEAKQMSIVAQSAGLNRESLYKMLSENGNPTYQSLTTLLEVLDIAISFEPLKHSESQMGEGLASETSEQRPVALISDTTYGFRRNSVRLSGQVSLTVQRSVPQGESSEGIAKQPGQKDQFAYSA